MAAQRGNHGGGTTEGHLDLGLQNEISKAMGVGERHLLPKIATDCDLSGFRDDCKYLPAIFSFLASGRHVVLSF